MVNLARLYLVHHMRLHEDIILFRIIMPKTKFDKQFIFDTVVFVERQLILVFENSEVLLVEVDESLDLLQTGIIKPKR